MADADELLREVHRCLGAGVDIQTYSAATGERDCAVEIRWRRDYGEQGLSDERFAAGGTLAEALRAVLGHEEGKQ